MQLQLYIKARGDWIGFTHTDTDTHRHRHRHRHRHTHTSVLPILTALAITF